MMGIALIILCAMTASANVDVLLGNRSQRTYSHCVGNNMVASWGTPDVLDGIVGRWTFDDSAIDSVGTNNGVWSGTAAYADGKIGKAASLDGSSYIVLSQDGRANFAVQEYTVSAWVYSSEVYSFLPVWSYDFTSHVSPQYAQSVVIYADNSIIYAWNYSGAGVNYISTSANAIDDGAWHHVVAVFSTGSQMVYVDGVPVASGSNADTVTYYEQPVWVGHSNFATAVPCLFDDVRFYNRALSSNEVSQIFNRYK